MTNNSGCERVNVKIIGHGVLSSCKGENLGRILASKGLLPLPCGGRGLCGLCRVKIRGKVSEPTANERIHGVKGNERLACQTIIMGDLVVEVPPLVMVKAPLYSLNIQIKDIDPPFKPVSILPKRLPLRGLINISESVPEKYFAADNTIYATRGNTKKILLVDLGTTKIAYQVIDSSAEVLSEGIIYNPLNIYGADIITRINHVLEEPQMLRVMQEKLHGEIERISVKHDASLIFIAGNSVMEHLYLGLPIDTLAEKPFQPLFNGPFITYSGGRLTVLAPLIAGYVGGDAYSEILATIFIGLEKPYMTVDLGTNTEVAIVTEDEVFVTSTPAGPAFEGHVSKGTQVYYGGITRVRITGESEGKPVFEYEYLGRPSGLLGAGIISLVAELYRKGYVDATGRFRRGFVLLDSIKAFVLDPVNNIYFTQKDMREFQKAYAAVKSAWTVLLEKTGLGIDDLRYIVVAGSFGSSIDRGDLVDLGLVPARDEGNIVVAGNMVLTGLKIMALHRQSFYAFNYLLDRIKHVNLAEEKHYIDIYVKSLKLGSIAVGK